MHYGFLSCVPILVLIIGASITQKMPEMLMLAALIGAIILKHVGFFSEYINLMYAALSNESFQFILLILVASGAMIKLLEQSGAMLGFRNMISRWANTKHKTLLFTWILGWIVFNDDYLNALAVGTTMRDITDNYKIPREHLAYAVNCMGACVCVLIPFSSWAAFGVGTFKDFGFTFIDYVHSIPFMFYPISAVVISILVGLDIIPKLGGMKKAYKRVEESGTVQVIDDTSSMPAKTDEKIKATSPLNFFIPMLTLIVVMIWCDNELIHGMLAAIIVQAILYIPQKIMSVNVFMKNMFEGIVSMAMVSFVVGLAIMMNVVNMKLGFSQYVIALLSGVIPAQLLPMITFLLVALVAFASGSFWPLIIIVSPVFLPMAASLHVSPLPIIAAMMSGIALGSQCCLYSDAVFMTAAVSGVPNVIQFRSIALYVLIGIVISAALFCAVGFVM